ncbi:hypothetical protein AWZ03_015153, partial [Drosophila navojoa]
EAMFNEVLIAIENLCIVIE